MATRSFTQKDGTIWEWEETPEVVEALKQVQKDYDGPLYAPRPELKKPNERQTDNS